jgi:hypothetical protein
MRLSRFASAVALVISIAGIGVGGDQAASPDSSALAYRIARTGDVTVDGAGRAAAWATAAWQALTPRGAPAGVDSPPGGDSRRLARFKMLYSSTGLYVLMDGEDRALTATMREDFLDLWTEDVFEFFLWPDERYPVYFEYEISPLGFELPILVPNFGGQFYGWRPWHYEGARKTKKAVSVRGGPATPGAAITGWSAEVFVPWDVLKPLQNVPPKSGTRWRANVYRMDYDGGRTVSWNWAPVRGTFHQPDKFGTLIFE